MAKVPFRFGEFAPDSEEYNDPSLEKVENGLPMYGGFRGIRQSEVKATVADDTEVATGAYSHLLSSDFDVQHGKVNADTTTGTWRSSDVTLASDLSTDVLYDKINESSPEDASYISVMSSANDPTFTKCRLEFPDLNDPGVDDGHILGLRYRYWIDEGTLTITGDIYEDTQVIEQGDPLINLTGLSGATGEWNYTEAEITEADVNTYLTDYTDLNLQIGGSISGMSGTNSDLHVVPDEDVNNSDNWENESGETSDLYASVNSMALASDLPIDSGDESSYAVSPSISDGESSSMLFGLGSQSRSLNKWFKHAPAGEATSFTLNVHAKVADKDATKMNLYLGDDDDGESLGLVYSDHSFTADNDFETVSHNITLSEANNLDVDNLRCKVEFAHTGGVGSTQQLDPASDLSTTDWTFNGGSDFNVLKDGLPATSIESTQGTDKYTYRGTITGSAEPETITDDSVKLILNAKGTNRFNQDFIVRLFYNGTSNSYSKSFNIPTTPTAPGFTTFTWNIPASKARELDWGSAFTYEIEKQTSSGGRGLIVSEVKITAPAVGGLGTVAELYTNFAGYQGFEVSFQDFILPNDNDEPIGDQQYVYMGSTTKLWVLNENGLALDDVSRATDYGQGSLIPQAWDFCSWGGNVFATNFEDEVQKFDHEGGGALFENLMAPAGNPTDQYQVQAKYCDIVRNHLVLANIGDVEDFDTPTPTSYTGAFSYTVWWSAINDPSTFKIGDYANLSDLEHIRQRRGEITGFLGGEYGTIWKRDSIFRMSWVGGNLVFRFDLLADGVGTSHPKSIVQRDSDIYFYGHNDFYVMPGGGKPQPLGIGKIKSLLVESGWDERAINRNTFTAQREHDMRVCGVYDQLSGLILWSVDNGRSTTSTQPDGWRHKTDIIAYNPTLNTWGYIRDTGFDASDYGVGALTATPTIPGDDSTILGNVYLFTNDFAPATDTLNLAKFTSDNFNGMSLTTNKFTSAAVGVESDGMSMKAIRPFFGTFGNVGVTSDSGGPTFDPPFSGTVYCSPDPLMINNVSSATFSSGNRNENGWAQLSRVLNGEFWKVNLTFPAYGQQWYGGAIKNVLGMGLDVTPGGTR